MPGGQGYYQPPSRWIHAALAQAMSDEYAFDPMAPQYGLPPPHGNHPPTQQQPLAPVYPNQPHNNHHGTYPPYTGYPTYDTSTTNAPNTATGNAASGNIGQSTTYLQQSTSTSSSSTSSYGTTSLSMTPQQVPQPTVNIVADHPPVLERQDNAPSVCQETTSATAIHRPPAATIAQPRQPRARVRRRTVEDSSQQTSTENDNSANDGSASPPPPPKRHRRFDPRRRIEWFGRATPDYTGGVIFQCYHCPTLAYTDERPFKEHLKCAHYMPIHRTRYKCYKCSRIFTWSFTYDEHLRECRKAQYAICVARLEKINRMWAKYWEGYESSSAGEDSDSSDEDEDDDVIVCSSVESSDATATTRPSTDTIPVSQMALEHQNANDTTTMDTSNATTGTTNTNTTTAIVNNDDNSIVDVESIDDGCEESELWSSLLHDLFPDQDGPPAELLDIQDLCDAEFNNIGHSICAEPLTSCDLEIIEPTMPPLQTTNSGQPGKPGSIAYQPSQENSRKRPLPVIVINDDVFVDDTPPVLEPQARPAAPLIDLTRDAETPPCSDVVGSKSQDLAKIVIHQNSNTVFNCPLCSRTFARRNVFIIHLNKRKFRCPKCPREVPSCRALEDHCKECPRVQAAARAAEQKAARAAPVNQPPSSGPSTDTNHLHPNSAAMAPRKVSQPGPSHSRRDPTGDCPVPRKIRRTLESDDDVIIDEPNTTIVEYI